MDGTKEDTTLTCQVKIKQNYSNGKFVMEEFTGRLHIWYGTCTTLRLWISGTGAELTVDVRLVLVREGGLEDEGGADGDTPAKGDVSGPGNTF